MPIKVVGDNTNQSGKLEIPGIAYTDRAGVPGSPVTISQKRSTFLSLLPKMPDTPITRRVCADWGDHALRNNFSEE